MTILNSLQSFLLFRRNQNYRDIIKGLTMSLGQKHLGNFDITNQFHHVFWLGDLNYRVQENIQVYVGRVKRIWYFSPMPIAKVQANLRIHAVSPEPLLLAHTSSESRGTFRQKARSLASQNGWACAVKICHDGMLEDTNSHDTPHAIPI